MDKNHDKNMNSTKGKNKKKAKSQDYIPPSPGLQVFPPPFHSQETPKNFPSKKAKKRKLNHDFPDEFTSLPIDSVASVPSSSSHKPVNITKNCDKNRKDSKFSKHATFAKNNLSCEKSIVDELITPSPVANRTRCGYLTTGLLEKLKNIDNAAEIPTEFYDSKIISKTYSMACAKKKLKHPNNSPSLNDSSNINSSVFSQATPPNPSFGSHVGGATPTFTPSLEIRTDFSQMSRKNAGNGLASSPTENIASHAQKPPTSGCSNSVGNKIPPTLRKKKKHPQAPKKNCRIDKFLNLVFPTNKFLRCTENNCNKIIYATCVITDAKKHLVNHLYHSYFLSNIIPVLWCSVCKKEITEAINRHPCIEGTRYFDASTDGLDLEF